MSITDPLNQTIDALGFREDQRFQAGWSTGRMDLVYRLAEADNEDELYDILTATREESRKIAMDGLKVLLGLVADVEWEGDAE